MTDFAYPRITVRDVRGRVEARLLRDAAVREFQQVLQCNPAAPPYPSLDHMMRAVEDPTWHVVGAWKGGKPMMFAIARESGEVTWLCACTSWLECTPPDDPEGAYRRVTEGIVDRAGSVHGHIENEAIRRLILRTNAITAQAGSHMAWTGDAVERPPSE